MGRNGSKGGKRLQKNIDKAKESGLNNTSTRSAEKDEKLNGKNGKVAKKKWSTKKKVGVIVGTVAVVCALVAGGYVFAMNWLTDARETPPAVRMEPTGPREPISSDIDEVPIDGPSASAPVAIDVPIRNENKITFLILGSDVGGNTDTNMVATFDVENGTFDIVNIPRDTLVNVSWNLKKVNSIYPIMRNQYRDVENPEIAAMEATVEHFSNLLGFKVDYWAIVNFRGFAALIDAIGGVDFFVPASFENEGVTVSRGQQRLNGRQALEVIRHRGYASADIGRVMNTQNFLTAASSQLIARRDSIRTSDMADVFLRHVVTDIPLENLVWLGERFLQLDPANINFHMMPGFVDTLRGSYVTIMLDEWLELVNNYINPFNFVIAPEDVSILTRGEDRRLMVTDGNWQGSPQWGAGTLGPANPRCITTYPQPGGGGGGTGGGGGAAAPAPAAPAAPAQPIVCDFCSQEPCICCIFCGYPCVCPDDE